MSILKNWCKRNSLLLMSPSPCAPLKKKKKKYIYIYISCVTWIHSKTHLNHLAFSFQNKCQCLSLSGAAQILTKVGTVHTLKAYDLILTSALDEVEWLASRPSCFTPGKTAPQCLLNRMFNEPQSWLGNLEEKISCPWWEMKKVLWLSSV
jgi:hypothetical protein